MDFLCRTEMNIGDLEEHSFSTGDAMLSLVLVWKSWLRVKPRDLFVQETHQVVKMHCVSLLAVAHSFPHGAASTLHCTHLKTQCSQCLPVFYSHMEAAASEAIWFLQPWSVQSAAFPGQQGEAQLLAGRTTGMLYCDSSALTFHCQVMMLRQKLLTGRTFIPKPHLISPSASLLPSQHFSSPQTALHKELSCPEGSRGFTKPPCGLGHSRNHSSAAACSG